MRRIASLFLSGLFFTILFASCTKEYSLENGGSSGSGTGGGSQSGTAVFTLVGAPGTCTTPAISGTYQVGTALDASNTVILIVDVTTIGTYTISTGTSNGIKFSGSGTFTVTGSQVLILTGTGTPVAAGTKNYSPGTNGCSFSITTVAVAPPPVAVGTLDCSAATLAGTYTQSIALTSANTVTIPVNVTTAGTYSITTASTNGCTFSGSGTLALGAQTVVLTGSGTGVNAGAISFPVSFGASNCNFSITFAPAPPPAVGVLDCAGLTVNGSYTQGTALGASNTISIPVNVTTAGLYSITASANGVTFSGSGVLASGAQTIVLAGSGTGTSAGNFNYDINFGASSCSPSITFAAGSTDFLKCSIDGGPITDFSANLSGSLTAGSFSAGGQSATQDLQIGVTDANGGTIVVGTYHNASPTNTTLYCDDQLTNIGSLTPIWTDLSPNSNIFTLNITSISATVIKGTFSGKLVDIAGGGGTKVITNGSFSITY